MSHKPANQSRGETIEIGSSHNSKRRKHVDDRQHAGSRGPDLNYDDTSTSQRENRGTKDQPQQSGSRGDVIQGYQGRKGNEKMAPIGFL
jgi:hypothetical protein